ncbi:imidazole glycerol phosphate synthase subunit HisH [Teredinibacter franksiae]|jgi:imidazole glycerol phosphate synthase subunit hisH (EC 2.4.2.-)|uniref:imidazole glycerol phosphate synthase subunit HisH n=1 Tax=Teredinibacter franksiae TaxID=2761453 RepID=UPI001629F2D9|nr:imidazole glycerol phosphate synthase subunit HisH [Teredinibacter franksiae]
MNRKQVAVIDYGMGNLHSVASALKHVAPGLDVAVTSDNEVIANADHVIFPGVGAIRDCIGEIRKQQVDLAVSEVIQSGKPLLAICVGLQALMDYSEENNGVDCLGAFPGKVKFFSGNTQFNAAHDEGSSSGEHLKVPHMGWNNVAQKMDHPLWHNIEEGGRFYFVHSYYVQCEDPSIVAGECHYGIEFTAAIARNNVFAAQFHPEKSHTNGLQLLENFLKWNGKW